MEDAQSQEALALVRTRELADERRARHAAILVVCGERVDEVFAAT
jgi:hypothetical protein